MLLAVPPIRAAPPRLPRTRGDAPYSVFDVRQYSRVAPHTRGCSQGSDEPGDVVSFRGNGRSVVVYILQDAYAFSFYDSRAAANREAKSPSLNI